MPTGFPRAITYDPEALCHISVVVRLDKGYVSYFCGDHDSVEEFPLSRVSDVARVLKSTKGIQVLSWIEVTDDGS